MPFETGSSQRKEESASYAPDLTASSLYNEAGRIRHLDVLEVGGQIDFEV
jgi:hypothetical protein